MVALSRPYLIGDSQVLLVGHLLLLVQLDRLWPRALSLIHDLNLALSYLDRVGVAVLSVGGSHLFVTRHAG